MRKNTGLIVAIGAALTFTLSGVISSAISYFNRPEYPTHCSNCGPYEPNLESHLTGGVIGIGLTRLKEYPYLYEAYVKVEDHEGNEHKLPVKMYDCGGSCHPDFGIIFDEDGNPGGVVLERKSPIYEDLKKQVEELKKQKPNIENII